jgi:hypothetical protein
VSRGDTQNTASPTPPYGGSDHQQDSGLIRWAAIEAAQKIPASAGWLVSSRARIAEGRSRDVATVAIARNLPTLVYYGLRGGRIRALAPVRDAA